MEEQLDASYVMSVPSVLIRVHCSVRHSPPVASCFVGYDVTSRAMIRCTFLIYPFVHAREIVLQMAHSRQKGEQVENVDQISQVRRVVPR